MASKGKHALIRCAASLFLGFAAVVAANERDGLFWSVAGEDGVTGYVLGTVHSEDPRVLEFTPAFIERLGACDTFAMELVPDLPTMTRLLDYMQLPGDGTLEAQVGAERYAAVREAMAGYGVPEPQLRRMKPWAAMMTLSLPPPKTGLFLDFHLSLRASGSGLDVVGLETLEEQLAFLEGLSLDDQLELLDQALADHARVREVHDLMVDTYLEGDLQALEAVAGEQMEELAADTRAWFQDEGIDARNRRMVDNALPHLAEGCAFIAVGALHLPGEAGVLALLREAGYRLAPLPSPFTAASGG